MLFPFVSERAFGMLGQEKMLTQALLPFLDVDAGDGTMGSVVACWGGCRGEAVRLFLCLGVTECMMLDEVLMLGCRNMHNLFL